MAWLFCIFALFLSSCDQKPQESHYTETVVQVPQGNAPVVPVAAAPADQAVPAPADQAIPADPHAGLDMSAMGAALGMDNAASSNLFSWSVPDGWKQEAGTGMRLATLHLISDPKAIDCSVVSLGGVAGGLEANLRRWMGQIGLQATPDELSRLIASAPSTQIKSGQEGKIFDFTTIQTKSQPTDKSLIVVMAILDESTLFVKMTGTVDSVSKNKADFFKLAGSVEYHAPIGDAAAPLANANPSADPHAGLDMSQTGGIIEAPTTQNLLTWVNPDGWKEEAGRHMRMASFHQATDPDAIDCYIIGLAGPAGGLEANLERWMGQLGLPASDDQIKQLIISVQNLKTRDGLDAKVFDLNILQPQGQPSDKSMIVAMIALDQTTVFVKMTGTIGSVKQNKDNFLKLLGSIARK